MRHSFRHAARTTFRAAVDVLKCKDGKGARITRFTFEFEHPWSFDNYIFAPLFRADGGVLALRGRKNLHYAVWAPGLIAKSADVERSSM